MPFWSGETIRARLPGLVDRPDPAAIDCAAYTLKVGAEYYVTPNDRAPDPSTVTLKTLEPGQAFQIPPGQFAYLLTEEAVTLPTSTIAFISIRARIKWRGLINVSGFHVDPGFTGKLLFAVYNAGPVPIHLRRGDPAFLIWFADLDRDSSGDSKAGMTPVTQIDTSAISQVAGEIYSVQGLADKIKTTEKDLASRITSLERANGAIKVLTGAAIAVLVAVSGQWVARQLFPQSNLPFLAAPSTSGLVPQTSQPSLGK